MPQIPMKINLLILALVLLTSGCSHETSIKEEAYVKLFSEPNYRGRTLTVLSPTAPDTGSRGSLNNLYEIVPDNETTGNFNDKASSVIYLLPKGWSVLLFKNAYYKGEHHKLVGTGKVEKIPDFGQITPAFDRQISSLQWVRE